MAFKIDDVLKGMGEAAAGVLGTELPKVQSCAKAAFDTERDALSEIAQARIDGDIDETEMNSQLDDEKEVLKAALLACEVEAKVAVQQAVNAAIDVLTNAIKAALKP